MTLKIVARGTWLYAARFEAPVDIVCLDYDWNYELDRADGKLATGQVPEPMGDGGVLYYGRFTHALDSSEPTWPDTPGHQTLEDAKHHIERKVAGGIRWEEPPA